ncbi:hypothetical protein AB0O67_11945 [Streptomyces sp. NPDC086077]
MAGPGPGLTTSQMRVGNEDPDAVNDIGVQRIVVERNHCHGLPKLRLW